LQQPNRVIHLFARDAEKFRLQAGGEGCFDMGFIDADKSSYNSYYELTLKLLRPGGVILVDNVLWASKVLEENPTDEDTTVR